MRTCKNLDKRPPGRSSALFTWAHEPLQPENPDQDCHGSPNISLDLDPVRPSFCLSVCLPVRPSTHPPHPTYSPSPIRPSLPACTPSASLLVLVLVLVLPLSLSLSLLLSLLVLPLPPLLLLLPPPSCRPLVAAPRRASPRLASLNLFSPHLRLSKLPQAHHLPPRSLLPPPFPHPPCGTRHASAS
ncbi:hypothetical protein COCVIDRAFT_42196 [Bipolaris victoriae FI3]|uniref:Uncharacterized protein n=1 Tax=Bipolaris victoriae (strain FI3) TaxID=930091 RepID=W7DV19_BIPV3|nr:hypothetical protein COCVIDRAFT_42196 [Bipolaris victoriae FI3]